MVIAAKCHGSPSNMLLAVLNSIGEAPGNSTLPLAEGGVRLTDVEELRRVDRMGLLNSSLPFYEQKLQEVDDGLLDRCHSDALDKEGRPAKEQWLAPVDRQRNHVMLSTTDGIDVHNYFQCGRYWLQFTPENTTLCGYPKHEDSVSFTLPFPRGFSRNELVYAFNSLAAFGKGHIPLIAKWFAAALGIKASPVWRLRLLIEYNRNDNVLKAVTSAYACESLFNLIHVLREHDSKARSSALIELRALYQRKLAGDLHQYVQALSLDRQVKEALMCVVAETYILQSIHHSRRESNPWQDRFEAGALLAASWLRQHYNAVRASKAYERVVDSNFSHVIETLTHEPPCGSIPTASNNTEYFGVARHFVLQGRLLNAASSVIAKASSLITSPEALELLQEVSDILFIAASPPLKARKASTPLEVKRDSIKASDCYHLLHSVQIDAEILTKHFKDIETELPTDGVLIAIAGHQSYSTSDRRIVRRPTSQEAEDVIRMVTDLTPINVPKQLPDLMDFLNGLNGLLVHLGLQSGLFVAVTRLERILQAADATEFAAKETDMSDLELQWLQRTARDERVYKNLFEPTVMRSTEFQKMWRWEGSTIASLRRAFSEAVTTTVKGKEDWPRPAEVLLEHSQLEVAENEFWRVPDEPTAVYHRLKHLPLDMKESQLIFDAWSDRTWCWCRDPTKQCIAECLEEDECLRELEAPFRYTPEAVREVEKRAAELVDDFIKCYGCCSAYYSEREGKFHIMKIYERGPYHVLAVRENSESRSLVCVIPFLVKKQFPVGLDDHDSAIPAMSATEPLDISSIWRNVEDVDSSLAYSATFDHWHRAVNRPE